MCICMSQPPTDASYSFGPSSCQGMVVMSLAHYLRTRETQDIINLLQVPTNDVSGENSLLVESTCTTGEGSAYPPAAPNAGLSDS